MEKIAITEWNGIVSPVYDMACRILLLDGPGPGTVHDVSNLSITEKSRFCERKQIATLLCGAISSQALHLLGERGIRVIPWICGSVARITAAYFDGSDVTKQFSMPGTGSARCGNRRRWCNGNMTAGRCRTQRRYREEEDGQ